MKKLEVTVAADDGAIWQKIATFSKTLAAKFHGMKIVSSKVDTAGLETNLTSLSGDGKGKITVKFYVTRNEKTNILKIDPVIITPIKTGEFMATNIVMFFNILYKKIITM